MIALQKLAISTEAQASIDNNIQRYAQLSSAGETIPETLQNAYRSEYIKDKLKEETHEKCAYCESRMLHVDYGDIEHIVPKVDSPTLRFSYSNLTLSCGICNTKKAQHRDILNPYSADPAEHLVAYGPMIFRHPASNIGLITERRLDLNRTPLLERRKERLQSIALIADQIARTFDDAIRQILIDELKSEALKDKEYSLVAQSYVDQVCSQLGL